MKGIRRAAAVCLTMTLAVSTLFGNTAWADMPQKTERKKCVHVHTEECYGEPDEEATSSQIGEEPTECTHVCTVESGCIRNTAVSSGTNEDDSETGPDDEETVQDLCREEAVEVTDLVAKSRDRIVLDYDALAQNGWLKNDEGDCSAPGFMIWQE